MKWFYRLNILKMKNILIFYFLSVSIVGNAQFIESFYLGIDFKHRCEQMNELSPTKYILDFDFCSTIDDISTPVYLGFKLKDRYYIELGYYKSFYYAGYMTDNPIDMVEGGANGIDIIRHLFLNIGYDVFKYHRLSFSPEISFLYGKSTYAYRRPLELSPWFNYADNKGNIIITYSPNTWKIDNGLHKHYFFLAPALKINYRVYNGLNLNFKIGYNKGFKTMGYYRGYFQINNEPKEYIENETKGNYYYFSMGLNFNFQFKEKPHIEKSEFVEMIKLDGKLKFNFGINMSSELFSDRANRYFLPSFGPIVKLDYGRLSFSTSVLFAKREFSIHRDNAISLYDMDNGTTSIYDLFLKYKTIESQSYLKYSFYKSGKWKLSAGLGFYIVYFYDMTGYYTLQHSDGKNVKNGFFLFSVPNLHYKGITPNLEMDYFLNKHVVIGVDMGIKSIGFYNSFMDPAMVNVRRKPIYSLNSNLTTYYHF